MNLRSLFRGSTRSAAWYVALVVLLPLLSLSILGMAYLWQNDQLMLVLAGWLGVTLIGYTAFVVMPQRRLSRRPSNIPDQATGNDVSNQLPENLEEAQDWTEQDRAVWRALCMSIESRLTENLPWQNLPDESLQLLSAVSARYNPHLAPATDDSKGSTRLEYRFTLPEALLVLSVASERYRKVILQHIPYAERVTVASLVTLYSRQKNIQTGYKWFNNVRRTLRLVNPLAAAIGELRDQFTNRVFDHLSINVQRDLKRLLLQEVVQVGIDLYSGKLKTSANELQDFRSSAYRQDILQPAPAAEPLRIVLAGQTSAGKSSLINALAHTLEAEVDILPTTDRTVTHRLQLDGATPLHIIDTVGLDHTFEGHESLMQLAIQADMLLLVVRANQPARAPDQQLWEALQHRFASMPKRRRPPLMLVMTHVDQLSPKNQWQPPYVLDSDDHKATSIRGALLSAASQIGLPPETPAIPVCLSMEKGHYNVDAVAAQLMMLQDNATLTQLNRRRVERGEQSFSWRERWSQVKKLGQVLGRAAVGKSQDRQP